MCKSGDKECDLFKELGWEEKNKKEWDCGKEGRDFVCRIKETETC